MNIVKDKSKKLNLSPLKIYFILNENDSPIRAEFLYKLNNYKDLTQGLFKFLILYTDNDATSSIKDFIGENNMILRLIENLGDEHQYLVNQINLNQNPENVLSDLRRFLGMASRQDIANIHKRINSYSSENPEEDDRIELFGKFISILQKAIEEYKVEELSHGNYDSNALGKVMPGLLDDIIAKYPSFAADMAQVMRQNLNPRKKVKDKALARICEVIQDILGVSDFEEIIGQIGNETADKEYFNKIPQELIIVLPMDINKKLPKKKRIIEFPIYVGNKKIKSIKFTSPDRGVLYALTLVKQREKSYLRREDFLIPKPKERSSELEWMKTIFENLNPKGDFLTWYEKMGSNGGHPLSVIKSHTRKQIEYDLEDRPNLCFFLNITTIDTREDTKYKISLSPENILLPEEINKMNKREIIE